jgi:signal transduction histidine kinase
VSLVTRLSAFFLAALAIVLVGFSLSLYLLAREYLFSQAEDRLTAALDTLAAAIDPEPGGLEWDAEQRHLTLGRDTAPEQPRWEVREPNGALKDRSANLGTHALLAAEPIATEVGDEPTRPIDAEGERWLFGQRLVPAAPARAGTSPPTATDGTPLSEALVLRVAVSLAPAQATLFRLAGSLAGLSVAVWLTAMALGRRLCRRALAPVTHMAEAARDMGATDMSQRLPDPQTAGELAELHHSFNGLLDRLEEAFARQQRFTGDASHQLRTPLTAMLGQLDLALRRERPPEDYRHILTEVRTQAGRLKQIVEAMLFLARADADADRGELQQIELATWLVDYQKPWCTHARAADLQVNAEPGPLCVHVQPILLGQLLDNLLENACKYSPPGTPIVLSVRRDGNEALLAVRDEGNGISAADIPHIFEPFYRTAEARRRGLAGAGLGLAVARRIAMALGGTVTASSDVGKGSCFTLRLSLQGGAAQPNSLVNGSPSASR